MPKGMACRCSWSLGHGAPTHIEDMTPRIALESVMSWPTWSIWPCMLKSTLGYFLWPAHSVEDLYGSRCLHILRRLRLRASQALKR